MNSVASNTSHNALKALLSNSLGTTSNAFEQLVGVSTANTKVAQDLLGIARKLHDSGKRKEANNLLEAVEELLNNNQNLQTVVSEIKPKLT